MGPVSSRRSSSLFSEQWDGGLLLGAAGGGPAGTRALLSGLAGAGAQPVQKPPGCVRVSDPEGERISKVSTGQERERSPKISGDPSISNDSKYYHSNIIILKMSI